MSDANLTISTNSLSQTLDVHQITPEYFILHYAEFIRWVIAKGITCMLFRVTRTSKKTAFSRR